MPTTLSRTIAHWTALNLWPELAFPANKSRRYLFLLSHMRSYSSVLAHVLGSSPNIDGYGETHIKYRHRFDLWRLQRKIQRSTGTPPRSRFLLDKILHNHIRSPDRFLRPEQTRALIFVRPPESTLRSILTMSQSAAKNSMYCDPELACDYYVSRLHQLRVDGLRLGKRAFYFDADAVVHQPKELLASISRWLRLDVPLADHYQTGKCTGTAGFGDPMPNIHAGKILDASASTAREDLVLPAALLDEATAAYERCRAALMVCCTVV